MTTPSTWEWQNLEKESMEEYEEQYPETEVWVPEEDPLYGTEEGFQEWEGAGEYYYELGEGESWFDPQFQEEIYFEEPQSYDEDTEEYYMENLGMSEEEMIDYLYYDGEAPQTPEEDEEKEGESWWAKLLGNKDLLNILAKAGLGALAGYGKTAKATVTRPSGGGGGGAGKPPVQNALLNLTQGARRIE